MNQNTITILSIDDDPQWRDLIRTCLEDTDPLFSIASEPSAEDGFEQLEQQPIDSIISDYEMPGMDGLEFLEAVRTEYPAIPFIMYTGKGSEEVARKAINAGADAYFQKEAGTAQYTILANQITTLIEKYNAKQRLDALEQKKHIPDGGGSLKEEIPTAEHDELMSMAVVKEVAAREGVDPVALNPSLAESIDPEALDALFPPDSDETMKDETSLTFTYCGYTITVTSTGRITLAKEN